MILSDQDLRLRCSRRCWSGVTIRESAVTMRGDGGGGGLFTPALECGAEDTPPRSTNSRSSCNSCRSTCFRSDEVAAISLRQAA